MPPDGACGRSFAVHVRLPVYRTLIDTLVMGFRQRVWRTLCLLIAVFGIAVPCLLLWVTGHLEAAGDNDAQKALRSFNVHDRKPLDYFPSEAEELKYQIQELEEIRASVRDELRVFEQKRSKLGKEISVHKESLARVKKELSGVKSELHDTREKLSQATREYYDKVDPVAAPVTNLAPIVVLPADNKISSVEELKRLPRTTEEDSSFVQCTYPLCFRYARCPLLRSFAVYVYNEANPSRFPIQDDTLVSEFVSRLKEGKSFTSDPSTACVFLAILDTSVGPVQPVDIEARLHSLDYWGSEGENHVLIELSGSHDTGSLLENVRTGRAIISRSVLSLSKPLRPGYDILLPPVSSLESNWRQAPQILPPFRDNLLYFQGSYLPSNNPGSRVVSPSDLNSLMEALEGRDKVDLETDCLSAESSRKERARKGEWALCGDHTTRLAHCSHSTFALVPGPDHSENGIGMATYTRLVEALASGAIPVLVGVETLPFDDVIDWQRSAVILPRSRFSDIHYILRSLDRDTILNYRLQGRNLWLTYFSSPVNILQGVVAIVRSKSLHPPPIAADYVGESLKSLPGNRRRITSPVLKQNFTVYTGDFWNQPPGPFFIYSTTPFTPGPVSGTQYINLDERGINRLPFHVIEGGGITGPVFEDLLLGNEPEEQFTVVMLTYQRNDVLIAALERLKGVRFLNKVVVVWNNEGVIPVELEWPDIEIPVEVSYCTLHHKLTALSFIAVLQIKEN